MLAVMLVETMVEMLAVLVAMMVDKKV